jgi:protein-serine/threonine kinase
MALLDTPDDAQASEGDGQDTSEPPSSDRKASIITPSSSETPHHDGSIVPMSPDPSASHPKDSHPHPLPNGHANSTGRRSSIPHSSPHHKPDLQESGQSHRDLQPLVVPRPAIQVQSSHSTTTSPSPSPTSSPSPSESNPWSVPPTLPPSMPPSQAPSRAQSMTGIKPDLSSLISSPDPTPAKGLKKDPHAPATPVESSPAPRNKRSSSVHSSEGGKFNLKDLLGSAPKLSRKSSARSSASSRKSDSEGGPKSTAGESTGLLKKYGTCERVAIGKGATSVVRLAHKWDRTEEKLYAVKVILILGSLRFLLILRRLAGVQKATQERVGKGICEEAYRRILYILNPAPRQRCRDR